MLNVCSDLLSEPKSGEVGEAFDPVKNKSTYAFVGQNISYF